ncbi:MAG: hypothetical protein ACO1G9_09220 [Bacteroidota bacterium]
MENNVDHLNDGEKKSGFGMVFLWVGIVIVALVALKLLVFPDSK